MTVQDSKQDRAVLSVSELTRQLKAVVETVFGQVCVEGEISGLTRAASGHLYFTLKDETAQIRAVMWRSAAVRLRFDVHDGLHVMAAGPIEVYGARGTYQIAVEQLVPQGIGALELAFRQLYERLAAEGLFRPERKRPLPQFPRRIALVTSPTGAAVRDMLQVITRRWPACHIVIFPVAVQGELAAPQIVAALKSVTRVPGVDVVITGRGGGSLEDLWAFNEEIVARAIFDCPIPVVSAVGHEIDVTIADLVSDKRALTPSEAAELVVPQRIEVLAALAHLATRLAAAAEEGLRRRQTLLDTLSACRALARPLDAMRDRERMLDDFCHRLRRGVVGRLECARGNLESLARTSDALSPLKVLSRGYTLTRREATHEILQSVDGVRTGDRVETLLSRGRFFSVVERVENHINGAESVLKSQL